MFVGDIRLIRTQKDVQKWSEKLQKQLYLLNSPLIKSHYETITIGKKTNRYVTYIHDKTQIISAHIYERLLMTSCTFLSHTNRGQNTLLCEVSFTTSNQYVAACQVTSFIILIKLWNLCSSYLMYSVICDVFIMDRSKGLTWNFVLNMRNSANNDVVGHASANLTWYGNESCATLWIAWEFENRRKLTGIRSVMWRTCHERHTQEMWHYASNIRSPLYQTVNQEFSCEVWKRLSGVGVGEDILWRRPDMWSTKNWYLHDDLPSCPRTLLTGVFRASNNMVPLLWQPYSPNLVPSVDFCFLS